MAISSTEAAEAAAAAGEEEAESELSWSATPSPAPPILLQALQAGSCSGTSRRLPVGRHATGRRLTVSLLSSFLGFLWWVALREIVRLVSYRHLESWEM